MRVCLVGGIFGKDAAYRGAVGETPETVLAGGLRALGHDVDTRGHHGPFDYAGFDVVHVHHLSYGACVAATTRTPFVFTAHWLEQPSRLRRMAARYVVGRCDASVVLSSTELRWQQQSLPSPPVHAVIPNGVDPRRFPFVAPPAAGPPWQLLYVGQLARFKGLDFLFDALASMAGRLDVRLRLAFHVDTDEARLRALAERLGPEVEFLGPRAPEDLARLYAESHALVLPSTGEALPTVVSEALFVGRPVIGTDVGAVREQVGDFGFVVKPRSSRALAEAIQRLAAEYETLRVRAAAASQEAVRRYSTEAMVRAHAELYLQVVNGRRATGRAGPAAAGVRLAAARAARASRRRSSRT